MTTTPGVLVAALLAVASLAGAAHGAAADRAAADARRSQMVPVLVQARSGAVAAVERAVRAGGGVVTRRLPLVDGLSARVERGKVGALRATDDVVSVSADERIRPQSGDCPTLDATCFDALPPNTVWQNAVRLSEVPKKYQGTGVTVAVVDTGVTPTPDLTGSHGPRLLARVDLTSEHDGLDHYGHGTHMIGVVAGDGTLSQEAYAGAAPEANVVSVKVAGWDGATDVSTVIAGLQWVVANASQYGIRVVNLSFGTDSAQPAAVDVLDEAVERVWRAGIVVVVSAGNRGPLGGTVTKPGDDPYVITVGAADINGTASPLDDTVADFSSRDAGKPDLVAPGMSVVATRAPGSTVDSFRPLARVGADYFKGTGTSQAAAVVSGVVARLIEANPALTPDQVKWVLEQTANGTALAGVDGGGAGLVDAAAAVQVVAPLKSRPVLSVANGGRRPSAGTAPLEGSRGTTHVVADLDGDGLPEVVQGEVDILGNAWDRTSSTSRWSAAGWAASPWAPRTVVTPGDLPVQPWLGASVGIVAWESKYWGALNWLDALWDSKYWGSKYWGSDDWE